MNKTKSYNSMKKIRIQRFFSQIILIFLLIIIVLVSFGFILKKPKKYVETLLEFHNVIDKDKNEIQSLVQTDEETKLIFRKKSSTYESRSISLICYVHFIYFPNGYHITAEKMLTNKYEAVKNSKCGTNPDDLTKYEIKWAAPKFHYINDVLVHGSIKNLKVSALRKNRNQVWRKKGHEIIFYPEQNIIQKNSLGWECYGFLGICN